jgi:hypothetical protein
MFISMKMVSFHTKRQKVFRLVLLAVWLVSVSASLQPAWAVGGCSTGVTNMAQHAGHHACCENATECPCEIKQGSSTEMPDHPIAPSSSLSYPANERLVPSIDSPPLIPLMRFSSDDTAMLARGPTLKVYLRILSFLI